MDKTITRLLAVRARARMRFIRRGVHDKKKLDPAWRKPKGHHNKMRRQLKAKGALPRPGYGSPRAIRSLHPSGYREVLVYNEQLLEGLNPEQDAIRIGRTVGRRKREGIQQRALEQGLKVLNPVTIEAATPAEEPEVSDNE
jgi:large subunit ribosomal protein L32e